MLLLIYCLVCFSFGCGCFVFVFVLCALFCALSSFAHILKRGRELVALLLLSYGCIVTITVL